MLKDNLFNIVCSGYDGNSSWLFSHPTKSKVDFDRDMKFLFKKYSNDYIEQEESWVTTDEWLEFIVKKLPELGYEEVITGCDFVLESTIVKKEENDTRNNFKLERLAGKELLEKALLKNEELENKPL